MNESPTPTPPPSRLRRLLWSVRIWIPFVVLVGAAIGVRWMMAHEGRAKRKKARPQAALVEVTTVALGPQQVRITAMGRVRPAREVELRPQVKGEVRAISPNLVPGGTVRQGEMLFRIDPRDYRLAVRQSASQVEQAEANLKVEHGRQALARQEFELLRSSAKTGDRDLVLRGPQLRSMKASVDSAQAALEAARLDLSRTTIRAPFNAAVQERGAIVGTRVTEATTLVRLIGTDTFWVELMVPVDRLRWIRVPKDESTPGTTVVIRDPPAWGDASRTGHVIRLAPDLEEKGRMARVIVRVDDPLALDPSRAGQPRLLVGSYVEAALQGAELPVAASLDRRLIRDGSSVWVLDAQDRLEIRPVTIGFRGLERVLVTSGLQAGERVITSDLATPVKGMPLTARPARAATTSPGPPAASRALAPLGRDAATGADGGAPR